MRTVCEVTGDNPLTVFDGGGFVQVQCPEWTGFIIQLTPEQARMLGRVLHGHAEEIDRRRTSGI